MIEKSKNQINIENMQRRMHTIIDTTGSKTVCSAKWLQTTTTLYNGHTHSCHHPQTHKIPLDELKENVSALHNTKHKKVARKEMLEGGRPSECQYCWNIEDLGKDHISDRIYKSSDEEWSFPFLDRILTAGVSGNVVPSYFEVAFDNTCNFKCIYCSPDVSSKWMEEIQQFGPYSVSTGDRNLSWLEETGKMPIPNREQNPYVDAFWEWWPELYQGLQTFRVTGGEPLLSKNMWRLLDYIKANPRKDFTLAINTNMQVPDHLIDKFIQAYNDIKPLIGDFQVYTSCEAHGEAADYIRFGMNYSKFMANVRRFLTETNQDSRIAFMVTFNALSITTFEHFLSDIYDLRIEFNENDAMNRIPMMISYLRWPPYLGMRILPRDIKNEYTKRYKNFVYSRTRQTSPNKAGRFYLEELDQIDRLSDFMLKDENETELKQNRDDFGSYILELDARRNTVFDNVFPELSDFLTSCVDVI